MLHSTLSGLSSTVIQRSQSPDASCCAMEARLATQISANDSMDVLSECGCVWCSQRVAPRARRRREVGNLGDEAGLQRFLGSEDEVLRVEALPLIVREPEVLAEDRVTPLVLGREPCGHRPEPPDRCLRHR